jgi:hypothetical protein
LTGGADNAGDAAIANAGKTDCDGCAAIKGGLNVFLDPSTGQCAWCDGCPSGQSKTECASSTCNSCAIGHYKATAETGINTDALKGDGWDTACTACPSCPAGNYRSGGKCLSGGGATFAEMSACVNCPGGRFKLASGLYDDVCTDCVVCDVGATRINCELANSGTCSGWATPTVTSVTGTGRASSGTAGNEILDIYGRYYGDERKPPDASDVIVKYGKAGTDQSTWYVAIGCDVVQGHNGLAPSTEIGGGHIRCLTAPGYGTGHWLSVTIGVGANQRTSVVYDADISYAAPIVAVYDGAGSDGASTFGGQALIVTGANFGPMGTPIDDAKYGEGLYQLTATSCVVSVAHTQLTCDTAAGAGKGLKLVVTIGKDC